MTNTALSKKVLNRRANCNIPAASTLVFIFSCFASVPMSIRQRDWKIWVLPFLAALTVALPGYGKTSEESVVWRILGWSTQAVLAGVLLHANKEDALLKQEAEQ